MKRGAQYRRLIFGSMVAGVTMTSSLPVSATCTDQPYLGSVCVTAAVYCPKGYIEANGALLPVSGNEALASLLGATYGGDGRNNFRIPDMRGRTPVGRGEGPGLKPVVQGMMRGDQAATMSIANLPAHNHSAVFSSSGGSSMSVDIPVSGNTDGNKTTPDSSYSYLAASPGGSARDAAGIWSNKMDKAASVKGVTVSGSSGGGTVTIGTTGGEQPFYIIPPQTGLRYCLATQGIYPPRP